MKLTIVAKTLLLVAVGIILVIVLYVIYEKEKKTPISLIPTPTFSSAPLFTPSPTPVIAPKIDTSNWKIYRNDKYGYEFKYPSNFYIEEPASTVVIVRTKGKEYLQIQYSNISSMPPRPENYIPNYAKFVGTVNIGGKKADKYYTTNPQGEGGIIENTPYTDYVVVLGERQWAQIDYFGEKDIANLFESIISTLKFIN